MPSPFDRVGAALLPVEGLAALAAVRARGEVSVVRDGSQAWVAWPPGVEEVWQSLLSVPGAEFFEQRDGRWYPLGNSLPRFNLPPAGEPRPLDAVLFPGPVTPESPSAWKEMPARLRLVPSDRVQPTTALRVSATDLLPWAEEAPTAELTACRAARCRERVILRGEKLPALPNAERFWGGQVLLPLGLRAEPDLPETALRAAAEVSLGEILLLTENGAEAIPEDAFEPLSRAAARLMVKMSKTHE